MVFNRDAYEDFVEAAVMSWSPSASALCLSSHVKLSGILPRDEVSFLLGASALRPGRSIPLCSKDTPWLLEEGACPYQEIGRPATKPEGTKPSRPEDELILRRFLLVTKNDLRDVVHGTRLPLSQKRGKTKGPKGLRMTLRSFHKKEVAKTRILECARPNDLLPTARHCYGPP